METLRPASPNLRLRQERLQRNWHQQQLADLLGTTQVTVSRWEGGSQQPSAYFREKLCMLFGKSAQELGLTPVEPLASSPQQDASDVEPAPSPQHDLSDSGPSPICATPILLDARICLSCWLGNFLPPQRANQTRCAKRY